MAITSPKLLEAHVVMPLRGAWYADAVFDTAQVGAGVVRLSFGGLTLVGTAVSGGTLHGVTTLRVVGGAAGLSKAMTPKDYRNVPLSTPLADALQAAGETLSGAADAALLAYQLTRWVTSARYCSELLDALAAVVKASWRVLPDGTVWLGTDSFAPAQVAFDLLGGQMHLGTLELGVEVPSLAPGVSLLGRNVSQVEHLLTDGRVRTVVTFQ